MYENKSIPRIKNMQTNYIATVIYYMIILMSFLAGNALSVLGGVDLVEHVYNAINCIHPRVMKYVTYIRLKLFNFKRFKLNHKSKEPIYEHTTNTTVKLPSPNVFQSPRPVQLPHTTVKFNATNVNDVTNVHCDKKELD